MTATDAETRIRGTKRTCCACGAAGLLLCGALIAVFALWMARRMTTDPGDTRLVRVQVAPSLDPWLDALDPPLARREDDFVATMRAEWPDDSRCVAAEVAVPIRAMPLSPELRGFRRLSPHDLVMRNESGSAHSGIALTVDLAGEETDLWPLYRTSGRLLMPGGYSSTTAVFAVPTSDLPGVFSLSFRGVEFARIELARDDGAGAVESVWSRE